LQINKGLATIDILTRVFKQITTLDIPQSARCFLLVELADIEYHLSAGASEKMQLSAMVGAFKEALDIAASIPK
jgi:replication factor C subunit 3/5